MKIQVFIITNGRSTFKYSLESLEKQTADIGIIVIKDMIWVDALNKCIDLCKSQFYLRVDDDMLLHNKCVEYMFKKASKIKNIGVYICSLWEDWSNRPGGYIKFYNIDAVKKVRFRTNKLGKVDKPFFRDLSKTKFKAIKDKSLVGLHACGTIEDEKYYRELWLKNNAKIYYDEPRELDVARKKYKKNIEQQYSLLETLKSKNRKYKTHFYGFIE